MASSGLAAVCLPTQWKGPLRAQPTCKASSTNRRNKSCQTHFGATITVGAVAVGNDDVSSCMSSRQRPIYDGTDGRVSCSRMVPTRKQSNRAGIVQDIPMSSFNQSNSHEAVHTERTIWASTAMTGRFLYPRSLRRKCQADATMLQLFRGIPKTVLTKRIEQQFKTQQQQANNHAFPHRSFPFCFATFRGCCIGECTKGKYKQRCVGCRTIAN